MSTRTSFSITTAAILALQITTVVLPSGVDGSPYDAAVSVSGGTPPYTWSLVAGSLPSSVALAATIGLISGTPTTSGTFTPTVQVDDSGQQAVNKSLPVKITSTETVPAQFSGLKTCTVTIPYPSEALSGNCNAYASPGDPKPAVYNGKPEIVYTDPVFNTKIKRLTPQPGMPSSTIGFAPRYSTWQSWSKNGTYLMLVNVSGAGLVLLKGTDPYPYIRSLSLPAVDGYEETEVWWSNTNDCLMFFTNNTGSPVTHHTIQTVNVCRRDALTTLLDINSVTDTANNVHSLTNLHVIPYIYNSPSADDTRIVAGITGDNGDGLGDINRGIVVFDINLGSHTATVRWAHWFYNGTAGAPGDFLWSAFPAVHRAGLPHMSPGGGYFTVSWNTYGVRDRKLRSVSRSGSTVTATSSTGSWSGVSFAVTGSPIVIVGCFDASFNGPVTISGVDGGDITYTQSGAGSSSAGCTAEPNHYGVEVFNATTGVTFAQDDWIGSHDDEIEFTDGTYGDVHMWESTHNDYRRMSGFKYGVSSFGYDFTQTGFIYAAQPDTPTGMPQFHVSARSLDLPGYITWSSFTGSSSSNPDCSPQIVNCAEIDVAPMTSTDGSNSTFYRVAHTQNVNSSVDAGCCGNYYSREPHATPNRDLTKIIWGSTWRSNSGMVDVYLVELP